MKNFLIVMCGLFFYSSIFASHTLIVCPATITCNYQQGTCKFFGNNSKWEASGGGITPFTGSKILNLVYIMGTKSLQSAPKSANLICEYAPTGHTGAMQLSINLKKFVGVNWLFSEWGDTHAHCSSVTDPAACAAE